MRQATHVWKPAPENEGEQQDEEHLHAGVIGTKFKPAEKDGCRQAEYECREPRDTHLTQSSLHHRLF
jgi:hypothetical protein